MLGIVRLLNESLCGEIAANKTDFTIEANYHKKEKKHVLYNTPVKWMVNNDIVQINIL